MYVFFLIMCSDMSISINCIIIDNKYTHALAREQTDHHQLAQKHGISFVKHRVKLDSPPIW